MGEIEITWSVGKGINKLVFYYVIVLMAALIIATGSGQASPTCSLPSVELLTIGPDTICYGDTITLTASNPLALSYTWTPPYNISNTTIPNPKVYPDTTTSYYVTISGISGNLIVNGDFSAGNTGFTSSYTYTTNLWPEATYYIGTNPYTYHTGFAPCGDHTTGNGNMMIVNGSGIPNSIIWQQNITVVPNTNYVFSCWLTSVHSSSPAQLQFFVNGVQIGPVFQASSTTCSWNMFYDTWSSGTATSANISIRNQNTALSGNDFAIDDIYFAQIIQIVDTALVVVENPSIFLGNDTAICPYDSLTLAANNSFAQYQWSNGMTTPSITVSTAGSYWLKVTTDHGCTAFDTIAVGILGMPQVQMVADSVCPGGTATLSAITGQGASFLWNTGDTTAAIQVVPSGTTTYNVTVWDPSGCYDAFSVDALVFPLPVVYILGDTFVCRGDPANLSAFGGQSYSWSPTGDQTATISVTPLAASSFFSVSATDINGCTNTASVEVRTIPYPEITLYQENPLICIGTTTSLEAGGGESYLWSTGEATPLIVVRPESNTWYNVTVTNSAGNLHCFRDTVILQEVRSCNVLFFPNAMVLSGPNNYFKPIGEFSQAEYYRLLIYNRWGQLLFETSNFDDVWDGTFQGKFVPEGVYVFDVLVKSKLELPFRRTGRVTVLW